MEWQPASSVAAGSRWLIVGNGALDVESRATTDLSHGWDALWVRWCIDGIHAVLLQVIKGSCCINDPVRISVCHVPTGTQIASLNCNARPKGTIGSWSHGEDSAEMYVSSEAEAVLVPQAPQIVSMCRLPSLEKIAQLNAPEAASGGNAPAAMHSMGWAAHGSLIAIAWHAAEGHNAVTVFSGSDGSLLHTFHVLQSEDCSEGFTEFTVCPDQPLAAAGCSRNYSETVLLHLDSGAVTALRRPEWRMSSGGDEVELRWAPGGQHLMMHVTHDSDGECQAWGMFTTSDGEWCDKAAGGGESFASPIWSSTGSLCLLSGARTGALDCTTIPPVGLQYFNRDLDEDELDMCFTKAHYAFVPGTRNLIQFAGDRFRQHQSLISPVHHWVYDASTKSSLHHAVPGLGFVLRSGPNDYHEQWSSLNAHGIAWHPTAKPAAIYALAEQRPNGAVNLVDTKEHSRVITWPYNELQDILQQPFERGSFLATWSPDGRKLAIVNGAGTVIMNFSCMLAA